MKGKTIFITGASSGIGRETAYLFAGAGARLAITYNLGKDRGEEAAARCRGLGAPEVLLVHLDIGSDESVLLASLAAKEKFGHVDVLINNAGTGIIKPFIEHTAEEIERQVRVNLEGTMKLTLALLPLIREGIINVGSFLAKNAEEGFAPYCASKFGLRGFTQALAREHPKLRVCLVNPDLTATALTGFEGRPAGEVAGIIFKAATGELECKGGGDLDVWELKPPLK